MAFSDFVWFKNPVIYGDDIQQETIFMSLISAMLFIVLSSSKSSTVFWKFYNLCTSDSTSLLDLFDHISRECSISLGMNHVPEPVFRAACR